MRGWIASRLLQTVLVVFLSLTAVFGMVRLSGDPVLLFMPMDIQAKDVNEYRERLGFNDPLLVQYARFMRGAVRGDFGESLRYQRDALGLVLERLPATLLLAGTALALTFTVAVPLGVMSAVRRDGLIDHVGTVVTVLGQAVPGFWLGLMLIYVFAVQLRWLPTGGMGTVAPLVTLAGLEAGQLLGGAIIAETIFAWPGLGRLTVQALLNRDFPVVLAAVSVISVTYTLINLAVDLLYAWLDPRTRR